MKKILIWLLFMLAMTISISAQGETSKAQDNTEQKDTTINVIGWFSKHDTMTYWINESQWQVSDSDTIRTASASTKVRIVVTDSTAKGYKMVYTFLEFPTDTLPETASALAKFQNQITAKYGQKIVVTSVHFETDEYGHITKYNNLGQIKKQAKSLFKDIFKDAYKLPEIQELKKLGFDINDYAKNIDIDKLTDGYLEELNMLFMNHGKCVKIGEFTEHEDATDSQFENTTYCSAYIDEEDDTYHITDDITSVLPRNELKTLIGDIVGTFSNDSIKDFVNENFDDQIKVDGSYEDYMKIDYLPNGWPYSVVRQNATMIGTRGKVKQTVISLDSYSFAQ